MTTAAPPSARSATTASQDGLEPACAKACPTDSIQFGPYDELVDVAQRRVATLQDRGSDGAYLYGAGDAPGEQLAGGLGAFFLLTEPPERYGLPAQADSPIQENVVPATLAAVGAGLAGGRAACAAAFAAGAADGRGAGRGGELARAWRRAARRERRRRGARWRWRGESARRAPARPSARGRGAAPADDRDMTPALGTPGRPGLVAARGRGRGGRRCTAGAWARRDVVVHLPARHGLRRRADRRSPAASPRPTGAGAAASRRRSSRGR